MDSMTDLTERLRGPVQWGYMCLTDGGFIADDTPIEAATTLENLTQENARLREALNETLRVYVELAESGDAGFWDPEEESAVIAARKALGGDHD